MPTNLNQFSQAIEQTKRGIYEQYDSLAKKSGKYNVKIDLKKIGGELDPVINNKVMKDFSPEMVEYAKQRKGALSESGYYTALETQEAIQVLNNSLKEFYRKPTPDTFGKAQIDALIANNLRKQLDATIQKTVGGEYQSLKKTYGSLRNVETDVTKRAIVDSRKNPKGFFDLSNVFTGYHIIRGITSVDPSTFVSGAAAHFITKHLKKLNDPNRMVKTMFKDVDKLTKSKKQE